MVLELTRANGFVTRRDVIELCMVTGNVATQMLGGLVQRGALHAVGSGRGRTYVLPDGG